jgi:uncharacterized FAD-dependent dehydrogenase
LDRKRTDRPIRCPYRNKYAPEIKFFATQIETTNELETRIEGMYIAGDGPRVAGNIVSAAATGLIPSQAILAKIKGA